MTASFEELNVFAADGTWDSQGIDMNHGAGGRTLRLLTEVYEVKVGGRPSRTRQRTRA